MAQADEILTDFLTESREGLEQLENDLVALESAPRDPERLGRIFRTLHTIKGNCGFLSLEKLRNLAHAGESLLGRLRAGELTVNRSMTDALLELVDAAWELLQTIQATGGEGDRNYEEIVVLLARLTEWGGEESTAPARPRNQRPVDGRRVRARPAAADTTGDVAAEAASDPPPAPLGAAPTPALATVDYTERPAARSSAATEFLSDEHARLEPHGASEGARQIPDVESAPSRGSSEPAEQSVEESQPAHPTGHTGRTPQDNAAADSPGGPASGNIRVDVNILDRLMNLVGELVLTRNQLTQFTTTLPNPTLLSIAQRLNLATSDLQEGVLKTRMQRIGVVWQRFPRMVRDLANQCGKRVSLEMQGSDTELDRSLIEAINDPLTHIVRNAIDHGIEKPEARESSGKPPHGSLLLRAFHESGQVIIEISDDGAGIDPGRVRQKLVERGLMSVHQASELSSRILLNSIFMAGFSTADRITHLSGRGVGMDVVRTNVERFGGTVDVHSELGVGTTFRIRLPLTLAIIPALMVAAAGRRYAIPQANLVELLSLEPQRVAREVERIRNVEVYRLRGKLLPLVHLSRLLVGDAAARPSDGFFNIVVLRMNDYRFGLVVDDIGNSEEIVVKPLGNTLQGLGLYAGATILGDGEVALILDTLGLARAAGMFSEERQAFVKPDTAVIQQRATAEQLLVCEVGDGHRVAVPLRQVTCLEEFPAAAVDQLVGQEVVQYRDGLLPLVRLPRLLLGVGHEARTKRSTGRPGGLRERELIQVIVSHDERRRGVGVVVDDVLDIAEQPEVIQCDGRRKLILGSAVIDGAATDLVDLAAVVREAGAVLFEPQTVGQP